jgi:hypothetical protein
LLILLQVFVPHGPIFLGLDDTVERRRGQRRHKKLTDWARQVLRQVRRWLLHRALIVVADSSFAGLTLLDTLQHLSRPITMITRLRLDAALYEPVPERPPVRWAVRG